MGVNWQPARAGVLIFGVSAEQMGQRWMVWISAPGGAWRQRRRQISGAFGALNLPTPTRQYPSSSSLFPSAKLFVVNKYIFAKLDQLCL